MSKSSNRQLLTLLLTLLIYLISSVQLDAKETKSSSANENLVGKTFAKITITGLEKKPDFAKNAAEYLSLTRATDEIVEQGDYAAYLIEKGKEEISRSQQPFGYYNAAVTVKYDIDGDNINVTYNVDLQKPTLIDNVTIDLQGGALQDNPYRQVMKEIPFVKGEIFDQRVYEAFKSRFTELAIARGYFDGKFTTNVVSVNSDTQRADIKLTFNSGSRYKHGKVIYSEVPLDEKLLQRYQIFAQNEDYEAANVSKLQQDLQGSGYFKSALVGSEAHEDDKTVDVEAQLEMNKPKHYALGAGYSTDSGFRAKFNFNHRYINRKGHNFSSSIYVSQKESIFDNLYRIPALNPTSDYYFVRFGGNMNDDTYNNKRAYLEGGYNFQKNDWEHRYSVNALYENFKIGQDSDEIVLLYPQGRWTYTSTTNRLNPENGFQARFELAGAIDGVLSDVSFLQNNLDLRYVQSFGNKHRFITRGDFGATWTEHFNRLPPSLRYFSGGDRSVRGYSFQKIGDRDQYGSNIGGKYLAVASAEYEYYVRDAWALAAFVDVGDAFTHKFAPKVGAGFGVHWRSPVGPIKVDIGHGFDDKIGDKYRLHINIGAELDL